ncbi:hypothetical protein N7508_004468 [Penicillium antarcticum]|uniref:uncharacterized protein n=1 Tax=Penicillium antarcticum TaxID=416450 RepID=UPI0023984A1D|nr:uncharacterized protein N7508_004468 [Penicillium antarcticum]KAJ5309089.1 hypothetical protein N7508_004468 [Penicillium antarcticum]
MFLLLWSLFLCSVAALDTSHDNDLITYVTLSQHRVLKWNVTYYDRPGFDVAPGYWFVAPYHLNQGEPKTNRWTPCQIGPYIFDQKGDLVWAGSCEFNNQNVYDFQMVDTIDDKPYLTMLVQEHYANRESDGSAVIYNNEYKPVNIIPRPGAAIDNHEFYLKEPPKALLVTHRNDKMSLADFGHPEREMSVRTNGFIELDINTGEYLFEWHSAGQITLDESFVMSPWDQYPDTDYLHMNSVDKNENGDYLISARHTNTIYLISGEDGHIIWRLGGKKSNFEMNFTFTGQHNARFMSVNETHMTISFLDNGANFLVVNEPTSSAMYIEVDLKTMKAKVLNRYLRPDGGNNPSRGNMQTLPNGNVLASWSYYGYMSEFTHDGQLLMDASFVSERFSTYRAYKYLWTSRPPYPPTLVASCYGVNGSALSTVFHVSWNGATEVRQWRFFARANGMSVDKEIGLISKNGFESSFIARGYMDWVSVQALDSAGNVIGVSTVLRTEPPEYWPDSAMTLIPDDPDAMFEEDLAASSNGSSPFVGLFLGFVTSTIGYIIYPMIRRFARVARRKDVYEEELGLLKEKV